MKRREFLAAPVFTLASPALARIGPLFPPDPAPGAFPAPSARAQQRLHQDFITYAPGIEYFMLGNGEIQAMVQYAPDRSGDLPQTFLGLTIFDPERFARKWSTFLFDPERGLERSKVSVIAGGAQGVGVAPENFTSAGWTYGRSIPAVECRWNAGTTGVVEKFFVPSRGAFLFREVTLENRGTAPAEVKLYAALLPNFVLFDEIGPDRPTRTVRARGFASMSLQSLDADVAVAGR
ncbi:MAG TPA: hypothetical protein VMF59_05845, partial [Bacteroidota bacterium]|nr:hypothetical protein [Bacteroidota bacterium]